MKPKYTAVRITQAYRDKLAVLASKNRRSMAQQLMTLIDEAEEATELQTSTDGVRTTSPRLSPTPTSFEIRPAA